MKPLSEIRSVYFLGIGGIGMSALARFFLSKNIKVSGYDKVTTALTQGLEGEGIQIHYKDQPELIPNDLDLVVYTPAIPKDLMEWNVILEKKISLHKRAEVLGLLTETYKCVAVAGTHGKTTTSTLIAHLLYQSSIKCSAFLGGISTNYNSNLLLSDNSDIVVTEADEYDRSFLKLFPEVTVLTSVDPDHLDIYGNHEEMKKNYMLFLSQIKIGGLLVIKKELNISIPNNKAKIFTYSTEVKADYSIIKLWIENHNYFFDLKTPLGVLSGLQCGLPGKHNVENAIAAVAVAQYYNLSEEEIRQGLLSFKGVKRRFERKIESEKIVYIDDYAHHPTEMEALIKSVRELYPNTPILGIFQPHLFTRTRDFADGFAAAMDLLDTPLLIDIYPAREKPIEGVSSQMLLDKMKNPQKKLVKKSDLLSEIKKVKSGVVLTIGAGDIDQEVEPIKNALLNTF